MDFFEVLKNKASGTSEQDKALSGVPPIFIPDSNGKPLSEWSIIGNTYQAWTPSPEPTVGNNKLDNSKIEKSSTVTNFTYTDSSVSFGSMTVGSTINSTEIKSEDTSYAFSFSGDTSKVSFALKCYDSSHTYLGDANKLFDEENRAVMTLLANTVYIRLVITTTVQGNISLANLMLNKGNTVMAFEPFGYLPNTGACPVQGVGDKTENLFTDKTIYHNTIGEDSSWNYIQTSSSIMVEVQPNTKYYIKTETILPIFRIGLSRNRPDVLSKFNETYRLTNTNTLEITTGENINYLVFQGSQSLECTWLDELYVGQGYKVPVVTRGKNLFDINAPYTTGSGGTRNYTISGLNPNLFYTCSFDYPEHTVPAAVYFNGGSTDYNGVYLGQTRTSRPNANGELTVSVRYSMVSGTPPVVEDIISGKYHLQVEEGSTATDYEPYHAETSTIYLNSPLMADEVLDSTGKREVEFKTIRLTSDVEWVNNAGGTGRFATTIADAKIPTSQAVVADIYCSHLPCVSANVLYKETNPCIALNNTPSYNVWVQRSYWDNNLDNFKKWLDDNEVYLTYKLAESTSETVDVPQIPTLKGNTVLNVDTEVQPINMEITYKSGDKNKAKTFDNDFYRLLFSNN